MTPDQVSELAIAAEIDPPQEVVVNCHYVASPHALERFAELAARETIAQWMIQHGYATGHGDTAEELLAELVTAERERCARIVERRAEERFEEHGTREHDTNACYYSGPNAGEYEIRDEEDEDCAAAIREGK